MTNWKQALSELQYDDSHLHTDFIRQDLISCIFHRDEPVATLLFSFYNIEAIASSSFSYFSENYPEAFVEKLRTLGIQNVMAMQYMAVHPLWRKKNNPPIHSGLILAALSNIVRDAYNVDAGIAPMRRDHKVNELYYSMGADCIIENHMSHNTACDLVASVSGRTYPHPIESVREVTDYLWETRIDLSQTTPLRKAKTNVFTLPTRKAA
jgi:hypothetical protein